jgi:hypothetical protein
MNFSFTCVCGGVNENLDTDFALCVDAKYFCGGVEGVTVQFFCHHCQKWIDIKSVSL